MSAVTKGNKRVWYSDNDISLLVDIIQKYPVVECKKTDATTWREKNNTWQKISEEYNAATTDPRSADQLWGKFDNLKKEARKFFARVNQQLYATGGVVGLAASQGDSDFREEPPSNHNETVDPQTPSTSKSATQTTPEESPTISNNAENSVDLLVSADVCMLI
nr:myb/SANT-like DNA-binding domain-containing protein 3 [Onthophagus taurus]